MKIPGSIRTVYDDQSEVCERLKTRVDTLVRPRLHDRWHYESRVKTVESFTLKIESGRFANPSALEDFFAATIVVRNASEVTEAERLVNDLFSLRIRRPEKDAVTRKAPEEFPFDDLRLYVGWQDIAALPPTGMDGILFEVQIKTFLQHAWSIATHDLVYKSDDANWSKMRIAYQIKAMLEHAEISIQEAAKLSTSEALAKSDERTTSIRTFIALMTDLWEGEHLPSNVRRLAENVVNLARMVQIDAKALRAILVEEKAQGRGPLTLNLTPYGAVLQTLFAKKKKILCAALKKKQKYAVIIPRELQLPDDIDTEEWKGAAVFIR